MKNKYTNIIKCFLVSAFAVVMLSACSFTGKNKPAEQTETSETTEVTTEATTESDVKATASDAPVDEDSKLNLKDGIYSASFDTDSSMFHINEAYDGKGILTVKDGVGTMHIVLPSQRINNVF